MYGGRKVKLTTTSFPALMAAIVFVGFSYARARFQYAPAKQPKAQTREKKIMKKAMLVRREQMRKMRQTSPAYVHVSFSYSACGRGVGSNPPIKTRKKAKLALNPGVCNPSGFPGFPSCPAICAGVVT